MYNQWYGFNKNIWMHVSGSRETLSTNSVYILKIMYSYSAPSIRFTNREHSLICCETPHGVKYSYGRGVVYWETTVTWIQISYPSHSIEFSVSVNVFPTCHCTLTIRMWNISSSLSIVSYSILCYQCFVPTRIMRISPFYIFVELIIVYCRSWFYIYKLILFWSLK